MVERMLRSSERWQSFAIEFENFCEFRMQAKNEWTKEDFGPSIKFPQNNIFNQQLLRISSEYWLRCALLLMFTSANWLKIEYV